jgi:hypothetical protein
VARLLPQLDGVQGQQTRTLHFEQFVGAAGAPLQPRYRPRQPEKTILYRTVQGHLETMLAEARQHTEHGFGYPRFVEKELRRYLECGQLANGFVRLRCKSCGYERLLAFSCKGRLCPSCHARRMHDVAFQLVDNVLPRIPFRQWVFTLPRPIRFLMARDKEVLSGVHSIFVRTLFAWQRRAAKKLDGLDNVLPGAVTFVQLFGSALNLNPHFHSLLTDGVFVDLGAEKELVFLEQMPPTQDEVEELTWNLACRVTRFITAWKEHNGLDGDESAQDPTDRLLERALQTPLLARPTDPLADQLGQTESYRCAFFEGFSLHANAAVQAHDRKGLLRLCRYGARQAFSQKQLSELPDGRLRYALKRPWGPQGARELVLDPTELLHRLAALLPKPYLNLTRYSGIFAPNANRRNEVCPRRLPRRAHRHLPSVEDHDPQLQIPLPGGPPPPSRIPWAELLRRTFSVDVLKCPRCLTGTLAVLAFITDPNVVLKILAHLRLPTEVPATAPARLDPQLEIDWELCDEQPVYDVDADSRGPP